MVEIIIIFVTIAVILYILLPLFLKKRVKITEVYSDISELSERKKILERNISDLCFDYQMGKLSDDDFNSLRDDYSNEIDKIIDELSNIMKTVHSYYKTEIVNRDIIEECPKCGWKTSVKNKHCANCSFKLK